MVEVKLEGLALDISTNTPVVILSPTGIDKVLPIWIGHAEAWAIAMELSGVPAKRPLTHDLMKTVIDTLGARVTRIDITELRESTFYAAIIVTLQGNERRIDARPSDSIALALKTGASIYVNEELFHAKPDTDESSAENPPLPTDREALRKRLENMGPEDFGKFTL